jgi:hypothetical protein
LAKRGYQKISLSSPLFHEKEQKEFPSSPLFYKEGPGEFLTRLIHGFSSVTSCPPEADMPVCRLLTGKNNVN